MLYILIEKNDKYDCLFVSKFYVRCREGFKWVNWFLFVEMFWYILLWNLVVVSLVDWFF